MNSSYSKLIAFKELEKWVRQSYQDMKFYKGVFDTLDILDKIHKQQIKEFRKMSLSHFLK